MTTDSDLSPESWEYARGYAGVFGDIPSSFTTVIRGLMSEHTAGKTKSSGNGKYFTLRLMKSPTLSAPIYFACLAFQPQILVGGGQTPPDDILKAFSPFEVAYLFGLIYLYRRAEGLVPAEEWRYIAPILNKDANVGFALGRAIPAIGAATGLIEATMAHLAVAAFAKHDIKGFKEYRRDVKKVGGSWNSELEQQRWGCNHFQVGSALLQSLGFGIPRANAFVNAFCSLTESGIGQEQEIAKDFRMAALWRESLAAGLNAPSVPLPPKYYPTMAAQSEALELISSLGSDESRGTWLQKKKEDLPPYQVGKGLEADTGELIDESTLAES